MNAPLGCEPEAAARGSAALPGFVQIEPVGQCNLRCRMCPIQFRSDGTPDHAPAFMDFGLFCRLVDQFPGLVELHLQGMGEPLMHPRFFDMVRYAARRGIEVSTNTNLTLLSERRAGECVRSGLRRIHVSLDGASAETYRFIRVHGSFAKVLRNIGRLTQARRRAGSVFPEIQLVAVAMRKNLHELPDLVRLAHRLELDVLSVQHLCHDFAEASLPARYRPMRAFVESETLLGEDPERVRQFFDAARAVADELKVALRLPNVTPRAYAGAAHRQSRCDWPWRGAYLSFAGDAMPCCMVATPDRINFGNVSGKGVAAVWNNPRYRAFREQLASGTPPEVCRTCAVYNGTF
jgi:radical SAM protein with 4Fe4S-binding SPASM domain